MSKVLQMLAAVAVMGLPLAAHAQQDSRAADLSYCAKLSDLYVRYVGRSEEGPDVPVKPDVNGGVALAKCKSGETAVAIPILERKLVNAGFTLPPRS